MKKLLINPSILNGNITVPPSKSHTLRAIIFGMMGRGTSVIVNYLHSPDTEAMISAARQFHTRIKKHCNYLMIEGNDGNLPIAENIIDSGNSGLVFRLIGAIAGLSNGHTIITGDYSIRNSRPIRPLIDGLRQLRVLAYATQAHGGAPIIIKGPPVSGTIHVCGEDSQPVSALLIAAAFIEGITDIFVKNPGERPWIDMTLYWLQKLKIPYLRTGYSHYKIRGKISYPGFHINIPGDFSSAAYPLVAALITGSEITLYNVDFSDVQGDKEVVTILQRMGANLELRNNSIRVKKTSFLQGMDIHVNDCIDAITILAVVGCFAKGTTRLMNGSIAKHKESNRISTMTKELRKMGAIIWETDDGMIIESSNLQGSSELYGHKDHRVILSLAVAALGAAGSSIIHEIDPIKKTYSSFVQDLQNLGADLRILP
ncbi:MAG: 3-phosphoshikimate 1-carboxyvinyltransferase [Chlamydiales bacterium]